MLPERPHENTRLIFGRVMCCHVYWERPPQRPAMPPTEGHGWLRERMFGAPKGRASGGWHLTPAGVVAAPRALTPAGVTWDG